MKYKLHLFLDSGSYYLYLLLLHHREKMSLKDFTIFFSNQKHVIESIHLHYSDKKKQMFRVVDEHKRKKSKTGAMLITLQKR